MASSVPVAVLRGDIALGDAVLGVNNGSRLMDLISGPKPKKH